VSIALPKADRDACVRVSFVADDAVKASLQAASGETLMQTKPARTGELGPGGPVCVRRGDGFILAFDGPASRVRYVVWTSP
jgi:hypothetical protein